VEQILSEYGIEFFFVDSHLVEKNPRFTPYELLAGNVPVAVEADNCEECASLYRPYFAGSSSSAFFARDPRTGIQVWSGEHGYPGDPVYLDFHKKRWPGGHRYWQVTHPKIDLGAKTQYFPDLARGRTRAHAMHFSDVVNGVLRYHAPQNNGRPILTAPFDAELFGHWWFEGPQWLKNVAKEISNPDNPVALTTCADYLDHHKPSGFLQLPEGSWGRNGTHEVWLNPLTEWTWQHIYPAELAMEQVAHSGRWRGNEMATRLAKQLARELLLLESSDWQFLITTEHARDYAEKRFHTHLGQFRKLLDAWRKFEVTGEIARQAVADLQQIEERDSIFPSITPEIYAEEPVTV
jgi:1,4-alpha-glucan branching enzyme